jgi:acetyl-CoA acetyltransferase
VQKALAAVVGVGSTRFGRHPDRSEEELGLEALCAALDDCGLSLSDVDGIILNHIGDYQKFCGAAGINPRYVTVTPFGGRNTGPTLIQAVMALEVGGADVVAVVHGNNSKSAGERFGESYADGGEAAPFGMFSPGAFMAAAFRRHMALYGTTTDHLGAIATTFRYHASLNPEAVLRTPMSIDDYRAVRPIVEPLRLFDYCLINDGGVALILTKTDRARDLRRPPAYILGFGQCSSLTDSAYPPPDFWRQASHAVSERAFAMSERSLSDVNALMIYDSFSPCVLFSLEGFGFCPIGQSGAFVAEGRIRLGGALPTNTSGGHLSESYMQGYALNVEAVRQIRGECGARQVPAASCVAYLCSGAITSSVIYGSEPT